MQHPDTGDTFVDFVGQPINVDDEVVYGSSKRGLSHAKITNIVPLVEKPAYLTGYSTGPNSRVPYVRQDQLQSGRKSLTEYYPVGEWQGDYGDPNRVFVIDPGYLTVGQCYSTGPNSDPNRVFVIDHSKMYVLTLELGSGNKIGGRIDVVVVK